MAYKVDFADLKARIKIEQVAQMLGLKTHLEKGQPRSSCPACGVDDRNRKLAMNTTKQSYFCFNEEKGGDCIQLAAHVLGIEVRQAAEQIARHFGLVTTPTVPSPNKAGSAPGPAPERRGELQELDYLDPTADEVAALGISPATADELGIGLAPKGTMAGRVCIPMRLPDGTLVGYCGVSLEKDPPFKFDKTLDERVDNVVQLKRGA